LDISAAASLFSPTTQVGERFWINRDGPSHRRAKKRISGSKNFRWTSQKDFCNNIGTNRTNLADLTMSVPDVNFVALTRRVMYPANDFQSIWNCNLRSGLSYREVV
jgi:hypothetical protein